jgi:hypothetical protein
MKNINMGMHLLKVIFIVGVMFIFYSCEDDQNYSSFERNVSVNVTYTLVNSSSADSYIYIRDLYESATAATLLKPGASRVVKFNSNVIASTLTEQTFSVYISAKVGENSYSVTHDVDYRKFTGVTDPKNSFYTTVDIKARVAFNGSQFSISTSQ